MVYKYKTGVVGGTFDKLHEGHKSFLRFSFSLSEIVYVAITSDSYTSIHKPKAASFLERKEQIENFLKNEGLLQRAKIVSIDDVFGTALKKEIPFEVIFVTKDSLKGGRLVNEKRKEQGLPLLAIEQAPLIQNQTGLTLSSTAIRNGLFDKKGKFILPESLRTTLHRPFGELVKESKFFENPKKLVAVGDITVKVLNEKGFYPSISIIDFLVERKKQNHSLDSLGFKNNNLILRAKNPPGTITPFLWKAIEKAFENFSEDKKTIIIVSGEEDLAVLPAILLAPIGFTICYGQPQEGMVIVRVDKESKERAINLINRFSTTRGY